MGQDAILRRVANPPGFEPERFNSGRRLTSMRIFATLLALQLTTCFAQNSSTITLGNGIRLKVKVHTGNNTADPLKVEMRPATGNSVYRILHDDSSLAVWAYELVVERLTDGDHFQILVKPAGQEFAAKFPNADGGKPTPTFTIPIESPPLAVGGTFTIDIPTNPGLFQQRTDTVEVQPDPLDRSGSQASRQSAPLIRFADVIVSVNGKSVRAAGLGAMVYGQYVMFYIPRRGGYFFSTQPVTSRPFVQMGDVDRNKLKFTINQEDYECTSAANILMQAERGQLWVYHDPQFKPNPKSSAGFFAASSDSLNRWLP